MSAGSIALLAAAGFLAGGVNSIAGGGSLISFPALLVAGYPALVANVTNTLGVVPGYASGTAISRDLLAGQRSRLLALAPVGVAGSLLGAFLLTRTPESSFRGLVPWLILLSCALLAMQPLLTGILSAGTKRADHLPAAVTTQFFGGVYGGFFGAGLGVMLLATLGLLLNDTLPRINALKQFLSLLIAAVAAVWFAAFGPVAWAAVAPVACGSLLGGIAGVVVARRLSPLVLRTVVIVFGVCVAIRLLL